MFDILMARRPTQQEMKLIADDNDHKVMQILKRWP